MVLAAAPTAPERILFTRLVSMGSASIAHFQNDSGRVKKVRSQNGPSGSTVLAMGAWCQTEAGLWSISSMTR